MPAGAAGAAHSTANVAAAAWADLPPAPRLLHSDKICEDGSMATATSTWTRHRAAATATCRTRICDACSPIIDYPDGDLYEPPRTTAAHTAGAAAAAGAGATR